MRVFARWMFALSVLALGTPHALWGQSAATVPLLDPAYADLARLESFGLVPRGNSSFGPWSVARITRLVRDAEALAASTSLPLTQRDDVTAILTRLAARFPVEGDEALSGLFEVEFGGGRSPGRFTPFNGLGTLDAVVNPLWMGRGGRAYGDRGTAALAARVAVPLGPRVALMMGGRASALSSTGEEPLGGGSAVEALSVRARLGAMSLQVGRDQLWTGDRTSRGLTLSGNGPPLDLIRLATDRPLPVHVLGDVELAFFVADLGSSQVPAHAKLFGMEFTSRPTQAVELGLTLLNKQLGEGAPEATLGERLKDLTWFWDWFSPGVSEFSDKLLEFSIRARPASGKLSVFAEMHLNDFDYRRPRHTFLATAGYRVGAELPRLGASERHALAIEASWLGPDVYLHHQFKSGHAARGFPMGSHLGPDSRGVRASYAYRPAAQGWWGEVGVSADDWRGDTWEPTDEQLYDGPERVLDGPDEVRVRGDVNFHGTFSGGRSGVDVTFGLEHARTFAFQLGDDRLNGAARVRFWRLF